MDVSSGTPRPSVVKTAGLVVLVEALVYANAVAAKNEPELYGASLALLSPLSSTGRANNYGRAAGLAATAGLGIYNMMDSGRDTDTGKRRFWTTFIGLHAVGVMTVAVTALTGGGPDPQKAGRVRDPSLSLVPGPESLILAFNRRF